MKIITKIGILAFLAGILFVVLKSLGILGQNSALYLKGVHICWFIAILIGAYLWSFSFIHWKFVDIPPKFKNLLAIAVFPLTLGLLLFIFGFVFVAPFLTHGFGFPESIVGIYVDISFYSMIAGGILLLIVLTILCLLKKKT